jgi:K+ transporter
MLGLFTVTSYRFMDFRLAAILSFALGLSISPIMIASNTLVHELTQANMRGKIFTALEIVVHFAFLSFMFIAASLAEYVGQFYLLISVGIFVIIVGIWGVFKRDDKAYRT